MQKEYLTIACEAVAEIEEKKSRFIATARPVAGENEANAFIAAVKSKHWNASHNVYAYYIYNGGVLQKFNDDGEPQGTAGMPVLEAIKKTGVRDVAVVVTRYFGGTLLGAAGLSRAYGKAAALGIEAAGIVKKLLCIETFITMDYSCLGKVQALAGSKGYKVKDVQYSESVCMCLYIPADEFGKMSSLVAEVSNARASVIAGGKTYIVVGA